MDDDPRETGAAPAQPSNSQAGAVRFATQARQIGAAPPPTQSVTGMAPGGGHRRPAPRPTASRQARIEGPTPRRCALRRENSLAYCTGAARELCSQLGAPQGCGGCGPRRLPPRRMPPGHTRAFKLRTTFGGRWLVVFKRQFVLVLANTSKKRRLVPARVDVKPHDLQAHRPKPDPATSHRPHTASRRCRSGQAQPAKGGLAGGTKYAQGRPQQTRWIPTRRRQLSSRRPQGRLPDNSPCRGHGVRAGWEGAHRPLASAPHKKPPPTAAARKNR